MTEVHPSRANVEDRSVGQRRAGRQWIGYRLLLVFALRAVLGVGQATLFTVIGIGMAWGLFGFSGAHSLTTTLWFLMAGAGIGAGLGGVAAWLRLEGDTWLVLLAMASLATAAGVGGAWGGYQFGAGQEVECCAMPTVTPVTYTAVGATVLANGEVMVFGLVRGAMGRSRRAPHR